MTYLQHFLSSPSTLATLALLLLGSALAGVAANRRRLLVFCTGAALSAIASFTLAPAGGWTTFELVTEPRRAIATVLDPRVSDLWAWSVADGPANVALYLPFGLTLGLLLRRPVVAVAVGAVLSVAIECYQAATTRIGTFADVVSNTLGTAIGAGLAAVALLVIASSRRATPDLRPAARS